MSGIELGIVTRMGDIDRGEWDALAARHGNPLLSWGFLALLEDSLSIAPGNGWSPNHILARREGRLVAAAPFYAKTHSMGEFVFDFEFAEAAREAGAAYYPKLVGVVPATPSPAWRVLVAEGEDEEALGELVVRAAAEAARAAGFGGLHLLWVDPGFAPLVARLAAESRGAPARAAARAGAGAGLTPFAEWRHQSFLWSSDGSPGFEDWLGTFSKNMRRNVRRERGAVRAAGIRTRIIDAAEAAGRPRLLERMADFYEATNDKFGPWAARFLERDFFRLLPSYLGSGWLLSAAFEEGGAEDEPLALAFLFEGRDRLWGRWWGASRFADGLHFELCYYLPIEYALSRGIRSFDPGMGSEHKAQRGFRSVLASSWHLGFDPRLGKLFERWLPLAGAAEEARARELDLDLPFAKGRPGSGTRNAERDQA